MARVQPYVNRVGTSRRKRDKAGDEYTAKVAAAIRRNVSSPDAKFSTTQTSVLRGINRKLYGSGVGKPQGQSGPSDAEIAGAFQNPAQAHTRARNKVSARVRTLAAGLKSEAAGNVIQKSVATRKYNDPMAAKAGVAGLRYGLKKESKGKQLQRRAAYGR